MGLTEEEVLIRDDSGLLLEDSGSRTTPRRHQWCSKFTNTLILSSAFFALGLCVAIPGPTLLDLGDQVKATTSMIMIVFAARSLGYLFGALLGGLLFDCCDRQLLLFITLLLSAVATAAIPWSLTLVVMATMFALQGVSMGVLDTGGNVFCIQLWGKQNGPYIQTLHFAFGIGAFIAPLLARPFLSPDATFGGLQNSTDGLQGSIPVSVSLHHQIPEIISLNRTHRTRKWLEDGGMYLFDKSVWNSGHAALFVREKRSGFEDPESIILEENLERMKREINKLKTLRYRQRLRRAPDDRDGQNGLWKWKRNNSKRIGREARTEEVDPTKSPPLQPSGGNGESHATVSTPKSVMDLRNGQAVSNNDTSIKLTNASVESVSPVANASNENASTTVSVSANPSTTSGVTANSTQIVSPASTTEKRPLKPSAATDNGRNTNTADGLNKQTIDKHIKTATANQNQKPAGDQVPAGGGDITKQSVPVSNSTTLAPTASNNLTNSTEHVNMTNSSPSPIKESATPATKPSDGQPATTARPTTVQPATTTETKTTQSLTTTKRPTTTTSTTTQAPTTTKRPTTTTTTPSPTTTRKPTTTTTTQPTTTTKRTTTSTTTTTTHPTTIKNTIQSESSNKTTAQPHIPVTVPNTQSDANNGDSKNTGADNSGQKTDIAQQDTTTGLDMIQWTGNVTKPINTVDNFIQSVKNLSRIEIAYIIVGLLLFLNSILVLVMYCRRKGLLIDLDNEEYSHPPVIKMCYKASLLLLLGVFFFIYVGLEVSYGALVTSFTVGYNNWPKEQGATVAAIFWGSLATGRGFSIFIARCCGPSVMLIIDLVFMLIGSLLLSFALQYHDKILWLGTLVLGLGMSSVFPAGISWAEKYIHLSGKSTAVFVIGSAMGQMIIPGIIGYMFEKLGVMILMRSTFALSLLLTMLFVFVHCVARKVSGSASSANRNGFMPLESDDIEDESLEMDLVHFERSSTRKRKQVKLGGGDAQYHVLISDLEDD